MTRVMGCEVARDMLHAWVDGELGMEDQVSVESHLRFCSTCRAHVEDLRLIGASLRLHAGRESEYEERQRSGLHAAIVGRWRAERDQSWPMQMRQLLEERRLCWAGIGATVGLAVCLLLTAGVMSINTLRSDSLAGVLSVLSQPGSDQNPMRLNQAMLLPRLTIPDFVDDSPSLEGIPQDDAAFALSTVVTREGRISDYELLVSHFPEEDRPTAALSVSDASRLRDAVSKSRFAPAQAGGEPVAVSMIWLVARTTVKSAWVFDFDEFVARPRAARARPVG